MDRERAEQLVEAFRPGVAVKKLGVEKILDGFREHQERNPGVEVQQERDFMETLLETERITAVLWGASDRAASRLTSEIQANLAELGVDLSALDL